MSRYAAAVAMPLTAGSLTLREPRSLEAKSSQADRDDMNTFV